MDRLYYEVGTRVVTGRAGNVSVSTVMLSKCLLRMGIVLFKTVFSAFEPRCNCNAGYLYSGRRI